jgi:hypothetical protein
VLALGIVVGAGSVAAVWWTGTAWQAGERGPGAGASASAPETVLDEVPAAARNLIRSPNPEEAIRGLSAIRDTALSSGKFALLDHVNVQGSAAAASDGKLRDELIRAGLVLAGFTTTLTSVSVEGPPGRDGATVAVTVETSAYEERDPSGKVVGARPRGEPQELRVVLLRGEDTWRITEILAKQS